MIWHYTTGYAFDSSLEGGLIRPGPESLPVGEKPIAWFSTEPLWENAVSKGRMRADGTVGNLTMDDLLREGMSLVRIGVDPVIAPYRWSEMKELSGMAPNVAQNLAGSAKQLGANPSRWRGTFDNVPTDAWKSIQVFKDGDWVMYAERVAAEIGAPA